MALADAVLDHELVRLALQIRAGGPDAMQAAVMLSFKIVSPTTTTTTPPREVDEPVAPVTPKRSTVN